MQIIQSVGHLTGDSGYRTLSDESPTLTGAERFLGFVAAQTAARTAALPLSTGFAADTAISFMDLVGGVSATNTFTISVAAGDKVNGTLNGTVVMNAANQIATLRTDGAGNWLATVGTASQTSSASLPAAKLSTFAAGVTTGSLPAGAITGAIVTTLKSAATTPGAQLVRTAAQMLADIPGAKVGDAFQFRIVQTGAGTLTLTADAGATVTLSGTMTVATNTFRDFILKFNTATTATITEIGVGTDS